MTTRCVTDDLTLPTPAALTSSLKPWAANENEPKWKGNGRSEGRRDKGVACGGVSTHTEFWALIALKPVRLKHIRQNHLPMGGGLGNTVQQHGEEWKEEANVISSQSTTRKEQTRAVQILRSSCPRSSTACSPPCSDRRRVCARTPTDSNSKSLSVHKRALKSVWPVCGLKK